VISRTGLSAVLGFSLEVQRDWLFFLARHSGKPQSKYNASRPSEDCQYHNVRKRFRKLTDLRRGRTMQSLRLIERIRQSSLCRVAINLRQSDKCSGSQRENGKT